MCILGKYPLSVSVQSLSHVRLCLPVHHQLAEFTQTRGHRVSDAIQPSHPLSFPSPPAPNPCQHQSLFQWVNSSHEVAKVLHTQLRNISEHCRPGNYLQIQSTVQSNCLRVLQCLILLISISLEMKWNSQIRPIEPCQVFFLPPISWILLLASFILVYGA